MGPPCDPENYWVVYNSSLFCNYEENPQKNFLKDIDANIAAADARWVSFYGGLQSGPFNTGCMADCMKTTCNCAKNCSYGYCGADTKA